MAFEQGQDNFYLDKDSFREEYKPSDFKDLVNVRLKNNWFDKDFYTNQMKGDHNRCDFVMDLIYHHIFRDLTEKNGHKLVYIYTYWLGEILREHDEKFSMRKSRMKRMVLKNKEETEEKAYSSKIVTIWEDI